MKKIVIIVLVILLLGGMFLTPFFSKKDNAEPAKFTFAENLATSWNAIIPIQYAVDLDVVKKVEVFYQDSLIHTTSNLKEKNVFQLNAGFFGLGTRSIKLLATLDNGEKHEDVRLIRVLSDKKPENWKLKIEQTLPHAKANFTQGLEFDGQTLYESTGDPNQQGATLLGPIDLSTGAFTKKIGLDANYFGEGITILKDKIYQLTYTQGKCFVYNKNTLQVISEFNYAGEGWGLCNDGKFLYMSDGTERITKRNPKTFEVIETIEVYDDQGPIGKLNELEFIDGVLFANVWMTDAIVAIQPETGKVLAIMDARELSTLGANGGDVLNGIAYNKTSKKLYMTGKYWDKIFVIGIQK